MKRRTKVTRKAIREMSPSLPRKKIQLPKLDIKFNITNENLSCFMSAREHIRRSCRKTSHSTRKGKKVERKIQIPETEKTVQEQRKIETSPDISRELSNSILSHIEQKGIKCTWNDGQEREGKDFSNEGDNEHLWSAFSNDYQKSYASTNDFAFFHTVNYCQYQPTRVVKSRSAYDSNFFTVVIESIGNDPRTTIMIRNIPNKYTIDDLSREVDLEHSNTYDFLYLPCDLKNQCNVGYGFINFTNTENLKSFYHKFHNYSWKKFKSQKICALTYARLQGLNQLIQHFQNSKVFKDKKYRPIIKYDKIQQIVLAQQRKSISTF